MPCSEWLRKLLEARRSPRRRDLGIAAFFWTGGASQPYPVREISLCGARIEARHSYGRGTAMRLTLRLVPPALGANQPARSVSLWARIVRHVPDGFCVQFLFPNASERHALQGLLESLRGESV
ncbi:MAG TPA: PilZ domain-containing protein [Bryobacteraceae bacterium]|nr:PilZ domain-containing protein [Bryobacteraceae bacterium]